MKKKNKDEMKFINYRKYIYIIATLAVVDILLNVMARVSTVFATSYSETVYPALAHSLGAFCGIFPFSILEMLIITASILLIFSIVRLIVYAVKNHDKSVRFRFTYRLKKSLLNLVCIILSVLLVFTLNCGINYNRLSFSVSAHIIPKEYTTEDLIALCELLIDDANELSSKIPTDDDGHFTIDDSTARAEAKNAMYLLSMDYPCLTDYYPNPKPVFFSKIMSYENITGIYSPFFIEANYNRDVVDFEKPYTICHELSHLSGYMLEDEANFIAYLACMKSSSAEFNYSGTVFALISAANDVYASCGAVKYNELMGSLDAQVRNDLAYQNHYWKKFETPVANVANSVNNAYLVGNGQSDGVKSYGKVTTLLLAYYNQGR